LHIVARLKWRVMPPNAGTVGHFGTTGIVE
jgi:hypothetical protein